MTRKRAITKAFTLMEVLVSMVLITLVSAGSWLTIHTVNQSAQVNHNHLLAENLLIQSQEEVYAYSQHGFASLQNCNFIIPPNPCGFANINDATKFPQYVGFTRSVVITPQSVNLKQAVFQITWTELGATQTLNAKALYSWPNWQLPGNIVGKIIDGSNGKGNILDGVSVSVKEDYIAPNTSSSSATSSSTTSTATTFIDAQSKHVSNFSFADPPTSQQFILSPGGTWTLTATKVGFQTQTISGIPVNSKVSTPIVPDIILLPSPSNAHIIVQLGVSFGVNSQTHLYQKGFEATIANPNITPTSPQSNINRVDFTIPFPDPAVTSQCFTVATTNAWRSGYAGKFPCTSALYSQLFQYQSDGWSSAVASQGAACNTANWAGTDLSGAAPDNICVTPGQNLTVNPPLAPVPFQAIAGTITDSYSPPSNEMVTLTTYWHNGTSYLNTQQVQVGSKYAIGAPAEQELFPNTSSYYAILKYSYNASQLQCCNMTGAAVESGSYQDGPLYSYAGPSSSFPQDIVINSQPIAPLTCGNANGNVIDASTGDIVDPASGTFVSNVSVNLSSSVTNQVTSGSGNYQFACSDPKAGYAVTSGALTMSATAINGSYYPLSSAGNLYYQPFTVSAIVASQDNALPNNSSPNIYLWPKQIGIISGTVIDNDSLAGIPGVTVHIKPANNALLAGDAAAYTDPVDGLYTLTAVTDSKGQFSFPGVPITWPPTDFINALQSNPGLNSTYNFNTSTMNYNLSIAAFYPYPAYSLSGVTVDPKKANNIQIKLKGPGDF